MFSSNTTQVSDGGYQISRSLRFNSADSTNLNRTLTTATNRNIWTWSGWLKRSVLDSSFQCIFSSSDGAIGNDFFGYNQTVFRLAFFGGTYVLQSSSSYRDPSAFYHVVIATDTTQATSTNRAKVYINGVQITSWATETYPPQNYSSSINGPYAHQIGAILNSSYNNMMLTEVNFIDGQALTPSSFGETNAQTGVWQPKAYSGSYGTNGFYLNFSDNSNTTAATLGKDYSGNGNNWTPNNFSVTAGAGNDSLVDSPTSYGTDTGAGGTVRGNYCTLNPLDKESSITLANGNLDVTASGTWVSVRSTFGMTSGKWYWETTFIGYQIMIGIGTSAATLSNYIGSDTNGWAYYFGGQKYTNSTATAYGASYTAGDIIGIAFDADTGSLTFYKNGTSQGVAFTGLTSGPYFPALGLNNATPNINFGQRPFAYTAPSGFKALCTQNLPTPTIGATTATQAGKFFNPVLYTGTGSSQSITGVGFQPDWVWGKSRTTVRDHILTDAVRGASNALFANTTSAQVTGSWVTAFNSDGFTVGTETDTNTNGASFVAWNWKANGSGSSNTAGSITSTVSANTTSGFSVVTYTGNGTANATFGHGLGVQPNFVIVKSRSAVSDWRVWAKAYNGGNGYGILNATNAFTSDDGTLWGSYPTYTGPTSSVITVSAGSSVNGSGATFVAYCFAEVAGYSKFGSYTGNGSTNGPFVYTGFRPAYVLYKGSSAAGGAWDIHDDTRSPNNVAVQTLFANTAGTEGGIEIDILSNGFKIRDTSGNANSSGVTYIFAAFADSPFKYALARQD